MNWHYVWAFLAGAVVGAVVFYLALVRAMGRINW